MSNSFRVTVLISGRGSNLESLIKGAVHFRIGAVISNKADAPGLAFARAAGIAVESIERTSVSSLIELKAAIREAVRRTNPDLVVLAGFMLVLDPNFVDAFAGRIINIHPSLLPELPGLDTHKRAIELRLKRHGCTVHVVDSGVDSGPIIAQAALEVGEGESESSLAARVLELEHRIYPWVVNCVARGLIKLAPDAVNFSVQARHEAQELGFKVSANTPEK